LFTLVRSSIRSARLLRAAAEVGASAKVVAELGLVTKSRAMAEVLDDIALASMNDQPVMLFGETGVGKSYVAKLIHMASKRSAGEFVECQPTFASRDLVMSELFGHVKGAFTGAVDNRQGLIERANGGSLFLDEIDQYPHEVQVALLHVLQTKEYRPLGSNQIKTSDFRLISATNYPEGELFDQKQMRLDFYHRIAKLQILLPPLRKRMEDIPDIAGAILAQKVATEGKQKMHFNRQAIHWLVAQKWPGNIRELESTVERGFYQAVRAGSNAINISDMRRSYHEPSAEEEATLEGQLKAYAYAVACAEFSRQAANHSATARALGIDRKRLRRILERAEHC
jgi:two-component system response regulator AtoC